MMTPPPRRLLMTADAVGGVWTYALELARGLSQYGVRTLLAVMGPPPTPGQRAAARRIPGLTLVERSFRLEWMADAEAEVAAAGAWLLDLDADFAPDVVHLNGYAHAALPWRVPVVVVAHSCVRTWWRAVHGRDEPPSWRPYADVVSRGLAAADVVVSPTRAFLQAFEAAWGALPRTRVIHNARSGRFAPADKQSFVLGCGRIWDEAKGLDALAAVAPKISWPIFLAGSISAPDAPERPSLPGVRMLDSLSEAEMVGWLGRAGIVVLPGRYEPFGLCALEAAASGCPLVLGDIPTQRELWDGAALFVDPNDRPALAAAVARLIEDPLLRSRLAARAQLRARRFAPRTMVAEYLSVYADARARRVGERGTDAPRRRAARR